MENDKVKEKRKPENSPGFIDGRTLKDYFCIDCDKKLSDYRVKRCRSCSMKNLLKDKTKNPAYGKKWSKETREKIINSFGSRKGEKNSNYKTGVTLKKHYCIEGCGKEISLGNVYRGNKRCNTCCKKGKLSPRFGKIAHGKKSKYKNIWMRSTWEVDYAKWLDKKKIEWKYEPKYFDLKTASYTPDFYLPKTNEYIEIKGYWRYGTKKKFDLFKEMYPEIKIQLIMKKEMENIWKAIK